MNDAEDRAAPPAPRHPPRPPSPSRPRRRSCRGGRSRADGRRRRRGRRGRRSRCGWTGVDEVRWPDRLHHHPHRAHGHHQLAVGADLHHLPRFRRSPAAPGLQRPIVASRSAAPLALRLLRPLASASPSSPDPLLHQPPRFARRCLVGRAARRAERLLHPLPRLEQIGPRLLRGPARSASFSRRLSSASRAVCASCWTASLAPSESSSTARSASAPAPARSSRSRSSTAASSASRLRSASGTRASASARISAPRRAAGRWRVRRSGRARP